MSPRDWKIRITDILECIEHIATYTLDMTLGEFQADQKSIDAVLRNSVAQIWPERAIFPL